MKAVIAALVVLALAGCASRQQKMDENWQHAMRMCRDSGLAMGTPEFTQCANQIYGQAQGADDARRQAGLDQMQRSLEALSKPAPAYAPPPVVVCRQTYYGTVCQ